MRKLVDTIAQLCGVEARLKFQPLPADDPRQRQADIRKAREQLDWQPTVALAIGLAPTIDYLKRFVQ